jgi:hypothetical protein
MTVDMQFIKIKYHAEESSRLLMQCRLWCRSPTAPTTLRSITPSLIRPVWANMNLHFRYKSDVDRWLQQLKSDHKNIIAIIIWFQLFFLYNEITGGVYPKGFNVPCQKWQGFFIRRSCITFENVLFRLTLNNHS